MTRFTALRSPTASQLICGAITIALGLFSAACGDTAISDASGATTGSAGSGAGGSGSATSSGSGETTTTTTSSGAGGSTPVGETITLSLEEFDVQPGTERQVCKTVNLPAGAPIDIIRMRSTMTGTSHHFNAYKVLTADASDPVTGSDAVLHDCSPAAEQLAGDAAYILGSSAPERVLNLPFGVAFHFEPNQRIILEQHVINTSSEVVKGSVTFEISTPAPEVTIEHYADIIWFANWSFFLPANNTTSDTTHCTVPYDVEIFGLTSHTHGLGDHFSVEKWTSDGTTHLYDSDDWSHPPYAEYAPTIAIAAGEGLEWTCTWKNTTSSFVGPGPESTDEMCMTFAYGYPKDSLGGTPIQCNK